MVTAAVVIIGVLWKRKHVRKFRPIAAQVFTIGKERQCGTELLHRSLTLVHISVDNVMYSEAITPIAILSNKADSSAIYEHVKDDERRDACESQATYEDPEMTDMKCFNNDKLVRSHVHNRMEKTTSLYLGLGPV